MLIMCLPIGVKPLLGIDRKTIRRAVARWSLRYGPRSPRPRLIDPFVPYLRKRVTAYPGLTGR
jgi:hypothetical protein